MLQCNTVIDGVALRKESVDRNTKRVQPRKTEVPSLSARRAWIEIKYVVKDSDFSGVALRKESVDRNNRPDSQKYINRRVALRKESVDRNLHAVQIIIVIM